MNAYTCPDTGRPCCGETMDPNYSPTEEGRWLDECRNKGRQWAYLNPETADCLNSPYASLEMQDAAEMNAIKDAKQLFKLYSNDELDEFLEGAREGLSLPN